MGQQRARWNIVWLVAVVVVLLDQSVKAVIVDWLGRDASYHRWELAGNLLAFEYVENTGAAFGILAGQTFLLSALAIVVTGFFLFVMRSEATTHPALLVAVGMVLGGSLGNLIDRVRVHHVVDFFAVGIWPKFNIADSCIVIGLILMALVAYTTEELHDQESSGIESIRDGD